MTRIPPTVGGTGTGAPTPDTPDRSAAAQAAAGAGPDAAAGAGPDAAAGAGRYVQPGRFDRVLNAAVAWLTAHGVSLFGSRVLTVTGRRSGEPRSTPVNLLELAGTHYLLAPRGTTQWVRNVRVAGRAELRVGRRVEHAELVEIPVVDRVPVIRVYLQRWGWEVGRLVEGLGAGSTDAEVLAAAPGIPVFRVFPLS